MTKLNLSKGLIAGILISLGGAAFLASEDKLVGSVLFTLGLTAICYRGDNLFTGKICYCLPGENQVRPDEILAGLIGNFIATVLFGLMIGFASDGIAEKATSVVDAKLLLDLWTVFARGILCGLLIFISVDVFKKKATVVSIMLCIPAFILSGWEHSIADMFYFSAAGEFTGKALLFIFVVILGNSVGGVIIPLLEKMQREN